MSFNLKQGWAEDYVGMWSNGLWNDFRGDHNFYGFVCEAETVCGKKKFQKHKNQTLTNIQKQLFF